jgi:hypothetical protein
MGTKFWEVVCDENGIGGSGEYCGESNAHLGSINVIYHEALGGKYAPCAVLFDLEPGDRRCNLSPAAISSESPCIARLCSKLRPPQRGTSLGPFVCGARNCSLCPYFRKSNDLDALLKSTRQQFF